jgi:hypothetical protein
MRMLAARQASRENRVGPGRAFIAAARRAGPNNSREPFSCFT